ncbi:PQQ-binding-like beta-propeller repeat protein [Gemmata sp. G18]|uniref:PQQ-binding-like beta-propeller repeat protein n=1 Tax=Gemmata palustris TaxID=2822762 RepID=A0ABS5BV19_9BACT|nr:PQQ-binding-like beta-propeller repeat protein [Gemmata palustris]MBP3957573.1 PQQ-binding-like beta-propeller repeat protein [Gemmata palustris]
MPRLFAVFALAFVPAPLFAADWNQWLGPKRDGGSAEAVAPWTEKDAPKVLWKAKVGVGFSTPVIVDGRVFVHARINGKDREELIALDAKTGKVLWRAAYDRGPYSSVLNTGPQATPTVAGNRVYAYGITGFLTCFEADTGKQVWQVDAFKKLKTELPRFGVCCSPLVVGNKVLVAVGGKGSSVVAFESETGEIAWQGLDEPASTSSPVLVVAGGKPGRLPEVAFMTTLRVVGLNPLDGAANWEFALPFQPGGTSPTPLVIGDRIVTSTMSNGTTAIRVTAGEKVTAEKEWQAKALSGYFSSGVASKDRVFLVTNTLKPVPRADLVCVELKTGKEMWKKEGMGYFHFGLIRTANGKLLVLDDAGNLKLIDAEGKEFKELCATKVCEGTLVTPALSNGLLYARDASEVICVQLVP